MFTTYLVADFRPRVLTPVQTQPAQTLPAHAQSAQTQPSQNQPVHTQPAQAQPNQPVPLHAETIAGSDKFQTRRNAESHTQPSGLQRLAIDSAGVRAIFVPEEWNRQASNLPPEYGSIQTTGPASKKMMVNVVDRGQPVSANAMLEFKKVLDTTDGAGKSRALLPSQIRNLKEVFGKATIGDNQHTNLNRWMPYTFKLFSASTFVVNGRPVIEVEGQFIDTNGQTVRHHIGIYAVLDNRIARVFLDAYSKEDYIYGRWLFKYVLKTIEWL